MVLAWLPHVLVWATCLAFLAFLMPSWVERRAAVRSSAPGSSPSRRGPGSSGLVVGSAVLSVTVYALTVWGHQVLPRKPLITAALESPRNASRLPAAAIGRPRAGLALQDAGRLAAARARGPPPFAECACARPDVSR
jgi:hypothetical protein